MSLRPTPVSFAVAMALAPLIGSTAGAQSGEESTPVRVLILRPVEGPAPEGFDELMGALRVMVGAPIRVDVVAASVPPTSTVESAERWGGPVARSEGASGALWLEPGAEPGRSVLWVVRLEGQGETAERLELAEPRVFDRMRALALAARPLLGQPMGESDPAAEEVASGDDGADDDEDRETEAEPSRTEGPEASVPAEDGVPPVGDTAAAPEASPVEARIRSRLALGATLRNDAVVGARLVGELTFLERGWAHVSGELMRTESRADGSERQRAQTMAFAGVTLGDRRVQAAFGAGLGVALAWPESQAMTSGFVLAAVGALTVELGPELFLSIPLTLEGVLARPDGGAIPGWQGSVGVLLGIAP